MYALITGASSGIGRDMAKLLAKRGYNLILVARSTADMVKLADELEVKTIIIGMDLSKRKNCFKLYHMVKDKRVEVLVNNAGFGMFGEFYKTDIKSELDMINVNIVAPHILTKLFLRKMLRQNSGYILNVASLAAFCPGPLMSCYYATKSYVYKLTGAVNEEIRRSGRNVSVSVFCPGPVNTNFNNRAGVSFSMPPIDSKYAAYKAIKGMFDKKMVIYPRLADMLTAGCAAIAPDKIAGRVCWHIQKAKRCK